MAMEVDDRSLPSKPNSSVLINDDPSTIQLDLPDSMRSNLNKISPDILHYSSLSTKISPNCAIFRCYLTGYSEFLDSPISPVSNRHLVIIRSVQSDLLNGWRQLWFFSAWFDCDGNSIWVLVAINLSLPLLCLSIVPLLNKYQICF